MRFYTTRRFEKDIKNLPQDKQAQAFKSLELLLSNPDHPSLNLKPMQGCNNPQIWEIRISGGYRLTFEKLDDGYLLRRVGTHDILRKP